MTDGLQQSRLLSSISSSSSHFVRRQEDLHAQKESESYSHHIVRHNSVEEGQSQQPIHVSRADALRLFQLVPQGDESNIGHSVPTEEELNELARPVPQEFVDAQVDWVNHGFYSKLGN